MLLLTVNELKPHIPGSYILLKRHDNGKSALESIYFSVCEVEIELAAFNRRVEYTDPLMTTTEADEHHKRSANQDITDLITDSDTDSLHSTVCGIIQTNVTVCDSTLQVLHIKT